MQKSDSGFCSAGHLKLWRGLAESTFFDSSSGLSVGLALYPIMGSIILQVSWFSAAIDLITAVISSMLDLLFIRRLFATFQLGANLHAFVVFMLSQQGA